MVLFQEKNIGLWHNEGVYLHEDASNSEEKPQQGESTPVQDANRTGAESWENQLKCDVENPEGANQQNVLKLPGKIVFWQHDDDAEETLFGGKKK